MKVIACDLDGTIIDSMAAKGAAFSSTFEQHVPGARGFGAQAEAIYYATAGTPRREQLAKAAAVAGVPIIEGAAYDAWSEKFTNEAVKRKAPVFPDVIPVLDIFAAQGAYLAISSSVPQPDLERTLDLYEGMRERFEIICGLIENRNFHKGIPHLTHIAEHAGTTPDKIVFVGDAEEDIRRGKEAGAITVARLPLNNLVLEQKLLALKPTYAIRSFDELLHI